jgi:hypothetical protein
MAAALALAVAGIATADKPVEVQAGNLLLTFNGGFSPKALSKTKPTPISFDVSGKIQTADGTHPPALKEFELEADKNAAIDVTGVPVCKSGQIQSTDTKQATKVCGDAIVGTGTTEVGIEFPEQPEIPVHSKLLVLNGGVSGGVTTLFIHAYITVPTPAAIVTTVKIKKIHKGRFGMLSLASIPKIAGGSGSVKSFSLSIAKGILTLKCPDGHINAHGKAIFDDGTRVSAEVVRTCTPKG